MSLVELSKLLIIFLKTKIYNFTLNGIFMSLGYNNNFIFKSLSFIFIQYPFPVSLIILIGTNLTIPSKIIFKPISPTSLSVISDEGIKKAFSASKLISISVDKPLKILLFVLSTSTWIVKFLVCGSDVFEM